ncbi:diguanylate cyclase (GGDEF)-like protein [Alkalispirillum mobile]|uniref:diguanylate cyclase n=1 Tax=Alkalispirillum mobile TaxID=85925 RepID=A0A498C1S4_9GAMM|nr:GGDEF domain-containing protein [Alkalispirillum mobile]RLK47130.1 diguanylate cyclase (GGDEF)-like protein [Alkalispirillum mobile]
MSPRRDTHPLTRLHRKALARGRQIVDQLIGSGPVAILAPGAHGLLLRRQRARLIISRVRTVAFLFAVLTPLWSIIDLLVFPVEVALQLGIARLLTSTAFLSLALMYDDSHRIGKAWVALGLLFLIPTGFFLYSHALLAQTPMAGFSGAMAAGYAYLPFVMLCGLAVFPLTALEAAAFAFPILAAHGGTGLLGAELMDWTSQLGALWLLVLITVVAALAGMSQLHFMAELVRRSSHDSLTGCLNRNSGEELVRIHYNGAHRSGAPVAVVFMDLDRFKPINDHFGHDVGDVVLYQAANAIREHVRDSDTLIRWGGEEFLLLLPGADRDGARRALARLMKRGLGLRPDGEPLTASIGVADNHSPGVTDAQSLVESADRNMYAAKRAGGNRVFTEATQAA